MPFAALVMVLIGAWLVDSAIKNRKPVQTLVNILRDPGNARAAVRDASGQGYATAPQGTGGGVSAVPTGTASGVLSFARSQIGKPYKWGTAGPNSYDCSGLVYAAFKAVGLKIPRTTAGQILVGKRVDRSELVPGDLVFPDPGHVQIYAGNGMVVEAPRAGKNVREVPMWGFFTARRVTAVPAGPHGSANAAEAYK